jgi:hypothetical protein
MPSVEAADGPGAIKVSADGPTSAPRVVAAQQAGTGDAAAAGSSAGESFI